MNDIKGVFVTTALVNGMAPEYAELYGDFSVGMLGEFGLTISASGVKAANVIISGENVFSKSEIIAGSGIGNLAKRSKKSVSKRLQYLGKTPSKSSRTGREVIEKMIQERKIRTIRGERQFQASNGKWYPINEADMAHITDAVTWWNEVGREYGAKTREVRRFMLDSHNYYLEHYSINRSQGASLGENYLPPLE